MRARSVKVPPAPQRCWRLDNATDGDGNRVPEERLGGWHYGGVYLHVEDPDHPPRFGGFDEQTADFVTLHWTEVPDPRFAPDGAA